MRKHQVDSLQFKLKMLRLKAGKSQAEFANELGISRSALANYETGKRQPDSEMLKKIAVLGHVMVDFLLDSPQQEAIMLYENQGDHSKKLKSIVQNRDACLDISHLSIEHKISMMTYYDYILTNQQQSNTNEHRCLVP